MNKTHVEFMKKLFVAIGGLTLSTASIHATMAQVQDTWGPQPGNSGAEWNLYNSGYGSSPGAGIMEYLYGNDFSRVSVGGSDPTAWSGTSGAANFVAVYAGDNEALYTTDLGGGSQTAVGISGQGQHLGQAPSISGSTVNFAPAANPFLFLDETGVNAYSDPALNGGADRMVTFQVTGYLTDPGNINGGYTSFTVPTYVIAFEDGSDWDYNDLVVQIQGVTPVPEPTTILAGAMLLLPFGMSTLRMLRKSGKA
jgi:hypothetical protein